MSHVKVLHRRVFHGFDRGMDGGFRVRGWRDIPHVTVEVATSSAGPYVTYICGERQILTLYTDQRYRRPPPQGLEEIGFRLRS